MHNFKYFKQYLKDLIQFSGKDFFLGCFLTCVNTLLSGIGLLMLIPLLHYAGWLSLKNTNDNFLSLIARYLPHVTGKLPLFFTLILFVVIITLTAGVSYWSSCVITDLQQGYLFQLRKKLNHCVVCARWSYLLERKLNHIEHMLSAGLAQVSVLTHCCLQFVSEFIVSVLYIAFSLLISFKLTVVAGLLALLLFVFLRRSKALLTGRRSFFLNRSLHEQLSHFLDGVKLAKSYNQVGAYTQRYEQLNQDSINLQKVFAKNQRYIQFLVRFFSAIIFVALFTVSFDVFHISLITLIALLVIYSRLLPRLSLLQQNYMQMLNIVPAFSQAQAMMREFSSQKESAEYSKNLQFQRAIGFEKVSYRYQQSFAIKDFSYCFNANTTTAIVGHSGAGKSTLADLILGLLLPNEGKITIDDVVLEASHLQAWRDIVSYVPQDAYLFNDTLRANLLWAAPKASEEDLWQALKLAAANVFVENLPEKLDTLIGDRGIRLSGGERQRIALARALLRHPKVLLLDEATSSLDTQNEELIYETIKQLKGKMTIIIIAHRLSTIRAADEILVLKEGQLVEVESMVNLCKKDSYFMQLFAAQLGWQSLREQVNAPSECLVINQYR